MHHAVAREPPVHGGSTRARSPGPEPRVWTASWSATSRSRRRRSGGSGSRSSGTILEGGMAISLSQTSIDPTNGHDFGGVRRRSCRYGCCWRRTTARCTSASIASASTSRAAACTPGRRSFDLSHHLGLSSRYRSHHNVTTVRSSGPTSQRPSRSRSRPPSASAISGSRSAGRHNRLRMEWIASSRRANPPPPKTAGDQPFITTHPEAQIGEHRGGVVRRGPVGPFEVVEACATGRASSRADGAR